jgi:hypothetical protein
MPKRWASYLFYTKAISIINLIFNILQINHSLSLTVINTLVEKYRLFVSKLCKANWNEALKLLDDYHADT